MSVEDPNFPTPKPFIAPKLRCRNGTGRVQGQQCLLNEGHAGRCLVLRAAGPLVLRLPDGMRALTPAEMLCPAEA